MFYDVNYMRCTIDSFQSVSIIFVLIFRFHLCIEHVVCIFANCRWEKIRCIITIWVHHLNWRDKYSRFLFKMGVSRRVWIQYKFTRNYAIASFANLIFEKWSYVKNECGKETAHLWDAKSAFVVHMCHQMGAYMHNDGSEW